ncbi:Non-histone chromosomal protein 6 [Entomortierella beljakovae]|nr:Non-histone chromosomal protein 6 [Entomortierella beljakovae]
MSAPSSAANTSPKGKSVSVPVPTSGSNGTGALQPSHTGEINNKVIVTSSTADESATHPSSSSSSTSDSDSDDDRNDGEGDGSKSHRSHHRHGIDRLKRFRYSHASHHSRHDTSHHSHSLPATSTTSAALNFQNIRSKTPPSRGSSVIGQHGSSLSLSHINDPLQAVSISPSSAGKRGNGAVSKKRRKDPLAPKRPSNAFFIFSQQHRQQAREEKKEGNQSELTKFLGQQWKSMAATEKKIYNDLATQDKTRYMKEKILYDNEQGQTNTGLLDFSGKASKKGSGKIGRPSKFEKGLEEFKDGVGNNNNGVDNEMTHYNIGSSNSSNNGDIHSNSNGNNNPNGHGSSTKKMEIQNLMNGNIEEDAEDNTSHDGDEDEEDVRMEEGGTEDDHDDRADEDEDEAEDDEDEDDEATEGGDQDSHLEDALPKGIAFRRHGEDVEMVDTHRAQGPGLVVSA